jgi:hypothetical protein
MACRSGLIRKSIQPSGLKPSTCSGKPSTSSRFSEARNFASSASVFASSAGLFRLGFVSVHYFLAALWLDVAMREPPWLCCKLLAGKAAVWQAK